MTKNLIIFALTVLLFIGSIWGSIADKNSLILKDRLREKTVELEELKNRSTKEHDQVLGKSANLLEDLDQKNNALKAEQDKVIELRKEKLALQSQLDAKQGNLNTLTAQLAEARAALQKDQRVELAGGDCSTQLKNATRQLSQLTIQQYRNQQLIASLKSAAPDAESATQQNSRIQKLNALLDTSRADLLATKQSLEDSQNRLSAVQSEAERMQENSIRELDSARAQIFGLEKILDQKNQGLKKISQEVERSKINMDILLSKITEQQDRVNQLEEEKKRIFNEISAKNDEIKELNEKLMRLPVN
ncbi:MAG: hypothetical protein OEV64_07440 [Desulfobulbaceae bacterium]|nr:hypothetical protein [Desulfobulbaceae bacterium]